MEDQSTYHLITAPDGQTIPARFAPGVYISITAAGKTSTTQPLNITENEFQDIRNKALTHHLHYNKASSKVTMTPKSTNPEQTA